MRGRAKPPPAPLPQRDGIDPVRVRLPEDPGEEWATVRDHLLARFAGAIGADRVDAMFADGRFVSVLGPVAPDEPYTAGRFLWFHRDFAPEEPVPFPVGVVYRDTRLVIADKPHFLATTPRGGTSPRRPWRGSAGNWGCRRCSPHTGWTG